MLLQNGFIPILFYPIGVLAGEQASQYSCGSAAACLPISFLPFLMIFSRPNQWNSFKFQFEKQLLRLSFTAARNSPDQRRERLELALATVYIRTVSSQRLLSTFKAVKTNVCIVCLGKEACTLYLISAHPRPARKETNVCTAT